MFIIEQIYLSVKRSQLNGSLQRNPPPGHTALGADSLWGEKVHVGSAGTQRAQFAVSQSTRLAHSRPKPSQLQNASGAQ